MGKDFDILEHTADTGIVAYGGNINEAFSNAAKAMFYLITNLGPIVEKTHRDIDITARDKEELMVDWLNELIYFFDTENLVFKRFEVTVTNAFRLKARVYGEKVDRSRHPLKTGIKAATYHMLKVEEDGDNYMVQVIFDI